jgi:two-component system sensor histidine kinase KdpD
VEVDSDIPDARKRSLEGNILFAENVGARVVRLQGRSVPTAVADFVSKNRVTQVFFGRSAVKGWKQYLYYHALGQFMRNAPHVDVHIVTQIAK